MSLRGKRIFYVEDDVMNKSVAQLILEQAGVIFGFERWGRETAITRLKAFLPVDLILLDLVLPGRTTGYDVFDAIRAESELAHIPIAAVSASDAEVEIPGVRAKGFAGFISKPINLRLFPQQIAELIQGGHVWYVRD
jgi:two-component system, cell cycle response regulator DivK